MSGPVAGRWVLHLDLVPGLTPLQIAAFTTTTQIPAFTTTDLGSLNNSQINSFTFSQISAMTPAQKAAIGM